MTIEKMIKIIKRIYQDEGYVVILYANAEYHPLNTGFFVSDLTNHDVTEFVSEELLSKSVKLIDYYTKDGLQTIKLSFE